MKESQRVLVVDTDRDASPVVKVLSPRFDVAWASDLAEAERALTDGGIFAAVLPCEMADELRDRPRSDTILIALISYNRPDLVGRWDSLNESHCLFPIEDLHELPGLLHHLARRKARRSTSFSRLIAHNRRLGTTLHRWVSFAVTGAVAGVSWGTFVRLCFQWRVEGLEHLRDARQQGKSVLLAVNHPRETDAPLYAFRLFWPAILTDPGCQPSLLAGGRIYARSRFLRFFSYVCRFYLVDHGMGPLQLAVLKFISDMRRRPGLFIVYPEGPPPDDPHEELRRPKPGVGLIAYHSDATVLPMVTEGVSRVFPKSFTWPRPFQSLRITIGPPIDVSEQRALPGTRETIDELTEHIFRGIVALKEGMKEGRKEINRE